MLFVFCFQHRNCPTVLLWFGASLLQWHISTGMLVDYWRLLTHVFLVVHKTNLSVVNVLRRNSWVRVRVVSILNLSIPIWHINHKLWPTTDLTILSRFDCPILICIIAWATVSWFAVDKPDATSLASLALSTGTALISKSHLILAFFIFRYNNSSVRRLDLFLSQMCRLHGIVWLLLLWSHCWVGESRPNELIRKSRCLTIHNRICSSTTVSAAFDYCYFLCLVSNHITLHWNLTKSKHTVSSLVLSRYFPIL
jgi:hypothetical protein